MKKKFNAIDYIIVAVVILAIALVVKKGNFIKSSSTVEKQDNLIVSFMVENVNTPILDNVKEDTSTLDTQRGISFGTLKSYEVGEAIFYGVNSEGQYVKSGVEGYSSVKLQTSVNGKINEDGIEINKYRYYIGDEFPLKVGDAILFATISDVQKED